MRKLVLALAATVAITGCTNTEKGAAIGGLGGAAVGAAVAGNDLEGALIGGAVGAAAGALIGRSTERGRCYYRDRYGHRYTARCPSGY